MTTRSAVHDHFTIERDYPGPPARVFNAFADPAAKARWFGGGAEWTDIESTLDFRVGGRETNVGRFKDGHVSAYEARYWDIVPNERIVYTYDMHWDDVRISVSLGTVEFRPNGAGTRLTYTEAGVYLDGYDDAGSREHGTRELLDALEVSLREPADA